MRVLDNLQEKATGMERPDDLWGPPLIANVAERETGKIEPMGFATRREYELTLTIGARFWANRAQVSEARKVAERAIAHQLYRDVLDKLVRIESAIMDGDGRAAYAACGELRTAITR